MLLHCLFSFCYSGTNVSEDDVGPERSLRHHLHPELVVDGVRAETGKRRRKLTTVSHCYRFPSLWKLVRNR